MVFGNIFPEPFIASIERTGAATFQRELDITRNQLLEKLGNSDQNSDIYSQLRATKYGRRYALPVKDDVDFNRSLQDVVKYDSKFTENHLDIIKSFGSILNGSYKVTKEGLYFVPDRGKARLTMAESASSVRSLLNLGIYLNHMAKSGDFLIIDEPELNLHPSNQRKMARLLAKIVNAGVRVFITTHSDYILKEFNNLMLLKSRENEPSSFAKQVMEKYGYSDNEMLDFAQLKIYAARKELVNVEGMKKKKRVDTLVPLTIGEYGLEIEEMDDTIDEMNEIQDLLLYERTVE
jgi:predicted ATPase